MEKTSAGLPDPVVRIEPDTFETARRRAVQLREAAIDEAVSAAARGLRRLLREWRSTLMRALAQRSRDREDSTCRS